MSRAPLAKNDLTRLIDRIHCGDSLEQLSKLPSASLDCTVTSPPYFQESGKRILDSSRRVMRLYPDVPEILDEVEAMGCPMALASRTEQPGWARDLLDLMECRHRFDYEEIFPSSKITHFSNLKRDTGIPYHEMLFFDDEHRNIAEVGALGVKCVEIARGLDRDAFDRGLALF